MAYERYGTHDPSRDEHTRGRDERSEPRGSNEERGFFERAGDEVASWFGDEEAEHRRREDQRMTEGDRGAGRDLGQDWRGEDYADGGYFGGRDEERGRFTGSGREWDRGPSGRDWRSSRWAGRDYDQERERGQSQMNRERGYRPMAGDYSRGSEPSYARSYGREDRDRARGGREFDPHYRSWRDRHMSDLDRDYAEYRREEQARFERDFGGWRERRMQKRRLLNDIREHMDVVGSDDQHVGTIDRVAGDRIVLTRSDPDAGGMHHSLSCAEIDRVEGDRVVLELPAEQAKQRWRDEARERALFEGEDQGEMGPRALGRSFEGTYR